MNQTLPNGLLKSLAEFLREWLASLPLRGTLGTVARLRPTSLRKPAGPFPY